MKGFDETTTATIHGQTFGPLRGTAIAQWIRLRLHSYLYLSLELECEKKEISKKRLGLAIHKKHSDPFTFMAETLV